MTIVAFAGPSLFPSDRNRFPGIDWRPPAEAGDLLRLADSNLRTICLIDGYFDHRPAVRHKEILKLLSQGVRVLGASSIGALRAAEMAPFGMEGIGTIYRAYAAGRLTGDDEVALVHGPAEWRWKPLSVPLVDVRATLCRAVRERMLAPATARKLIGSARAIHYIDRNWTAMLAEAQLGAKEAAAFRGWLPSGEVPLKRLDASACIEAALTVNPSDDARPEFVPTAFARALAAELGLEPCSGPTPGRLPEA